jgi:hypothetical protein
LYAPKQAIVPKVERASVPTIAFRSGSRYFTVRLEKGGADGCATVELYRISLPAGRSMPVVEGWMKWLKIQKVLAGIS